MLITSLLLIVIAVLGIALGVLWTRLKKLEQAAAATPVKNTAQTTTASAARPLVDLVPPASAAKEYDPDATRVHIRPPLEASHTVLTHRQGAAPMPAAGAHLVGMSGIHKGHKFPIKPGGTTVGRSRTCDIVLADNRVSSHHAWIGVENGKTLLRDLESTNGTFLNTHTNESVSEAELVSGDTIFFGSHQGDQFRFVLD